MNDRGLEKSGSSKIIRDGELAQATEMLRPRISAASLDSHPNSDENAYKHVDSDKVGDIPRECADLLRCCFAVNSSRHPPESVK